MKRLAVFLSVSVMAFLLTGAIWAASGTCAVSGYVYDPCGGCFTVQGPCKPCLVERELYDSLTWAAERSGVKGRVEIRVRNLLYEENQLELKQALASRGIADLAGYPVVFLGNRVLVGQDEVNTILPELLRRECMGPLANLFSDKTAVAEERSSVTLENDGQNRAVYFKVEGCSECAQAEAFFASLESYDFELVEYDAANHALLRAYCERYGLDIDDFIAPTVFVGSHVLQGAEEIELFMEARLRAGEAAFTPVAAL